MKITFTIGSTVSTLADDTAAPRIAGVIEQWGGSAKVQTEPLYGAVNEVDFPRGNIGGDFTFTAGCSFATVDAAGAAFATAYALLNSQGSVKVYPSGGSAVITMANAVLKDVTRTEYNGHWLKLRYTFKITTITSS
ncbi:MAG: hypothetical protein JWR19_525 [Pedosphaera sp.]|nr:hypothetical protein [Pedosphaera sp.]